MGLCWPGQAKGTCVHADPNQHHLAHRMLSYHTQEKVIKKARSDNQAHFVFVLSSRGALTPEPAFLPCKPGCPAIREKPIFSFLLARSSRRDPAKCFQARLAG